MFYNTSYKIVLLAICFLRISAFGFLIHEAFDALFGCLFKFLKVYFHFSNLAICRQQLVLLISLGFHCFLYIGLLQAMGKGVVKVGIYQGYEFVVLQYNQ